MTDVRRLILWALFPVTYVGCSENQEPVQPYTGNVPITAWVVLGPMENVGTRDNRGCRLTVEEIGDFLTQLKANERIFGANTNFVLPENLLGVVDYRLATENRPHWFNYFQDNILANYWESGHLNVYFAGAYQTPPPIGLPLAMNCDPADNPPFGRTFILMNDGGFTEGSWFRSGFSPAEVLSYYVFEHEVAHFLLRRDNFPPYDSGEHIPCPDPDNRPSHLLDGCGVGPDGGQPGHDLILPSSEKREIGCRVWDGVWVQPSLECGPPALFSMGESR